MQRSAGGNPQAGREQRQANSFNMRRNNRGNEANFSTREQTWPETEKAAVEASQPISHAQQTEETVVEGYYGNLGYPCVVTMEQPAVNKQDTTVNRSDIISLLVDSGASGHYLDSDPITGLDDVLAGYKAIDHPVRIDGAGGHEFHGVGEGTLTATAGDVNGINRMVKFKCTTVPGLGRHLFSSGEAQIRGADTIISANPRIELPSDMDDNRILHLS